MPHGFGVQTFVLVISVTMKNISIYLETITEFPPHVECNPWSPETHGVAFLKPLHLKI